MAHTLHPILSDERINISRHELGHATLAHLCGYVVDGIEMGAARGCTVITYGVSAATFASAYEQSPIRAAMALVQIIAIIRVGAYVELHAGMHGSQSSGQDLADLESWRDITTQMGGQQWWARLFAESARGVQAWYRQPTVQRCISEMAPALARAGSLSRWAMLSLFEQAGVGSIPDPHWTPVIVPATYMPSAPSHAVPRPPTAAAPSQGQRTGYTPIELESRGEFGLFKLVSPRTGASFFVISRDKCLDRQGQLVLDTWEFDDEHAARRQFAQLA